MINSAIDQRIRESTDLDWKEKVHNTGTQIAQEEFAKDVAAMANSGGGWIVYGVRDGGDDAATAVAPVQWSAAADEQRLRRIAYSLIAPALAGLDFAVVNQPDGDGAVVAMRVPDGPDKPYFVRKGQDALQAPRRNGPHTYYMTDREIEDAFRRRFGARAERDSTLSALYDDAAAELAPARGVRFVMAALPQEPRAVGEPWDQDRAREIMAVPPSSPYYAGDRMWTTGDFRRGLRRWIERNTGDRAFLRAAHEDGTVTTTHLLGGWQVGEQGRHYYPADQPNHCMSVDIERAAADGFELIRRVASELSIASGYAIRAGLVGLPESPIMIRTVQTGNLLLPEEYMQPIHRFHKITIEIDPLASHDDVLAGLSALCRDLVNQGGVQHLRLINSVQTETD